MRSAEASTTTTGKMTLSNGCRRSRRSSACPLPARSRSSSGHSGGHARASARGFPRLWQRHRSAIGDERVTTTADPGRVESLEAQIRDLQAVYAQLDAYAKDLNRTYLELRLRLQQMTTLSALATRLAGARNVDACIRICADGIIDLFPDSVSAIYLEDHHEALKLVAA